MSVRSIVVVSLALLCGGSAASGVLMYQSRGATTAAPAAAERVMLLVAKEAIARGQVLSQDLVREQAWPQDLLPEGAVSDISLIDQRAAMVPLVAGEPILLAKLASQEAGRGLPSLIPKGKRAYAIQVSSVGSNVAGFVRPGDRVDVLLNLKDSARDGSGGGRTTTLLQAVEVLAVGRLIDPVPGEEVDAKELTSVTLVVDPEQVAMLDLGHNMGSLSLSLRNPEDTAETAIAMKTGNDIRPLLGQADEPQVGTIESLDAEFEDSPAVVPERPVHLIRTLRGGQWGRVEVSEARN